MKIIVVHAAALGAELFHRFASASCWNSLHSREIDSFFPALTAPAQAAFRTGGGVDLHGMGAGGYFDRSLKRTFFLEQSSAIYSGERIWDSFRKRGGKVAQICMEQCQGLDCDIYLSPSPIRKVQGGMIDDFLSEPEELYESICEETGKELNTSHLRGPFTSGKASQWITEATVSVAQRMAEEKDVLIMSYLPLLNREPQRSGPESEETKEAFEEFEECISDIFAAAKEHGYELMIIGDYEITDAFCPLYPNKILAENGYFKVREADGMMYPNFYSSRAFALAEHQICHIYVADPEKDLAAIQSLFEAVPGISCVIRRADAPEWDHERCGELILEAEPGAWFSYHWWEDPDQAPDYATHAGVRTKPGFDPMEIYWKIWPPLSVPLDCTMLRGTHGRQCKVMAATTFDPQEDIHSFLGYSAMLKEILDHDALPDNL